MVGGGDNCEFVIQPRGHHLVVVVTPPTSVPQMAVCVT